MDEPQTTEEPGHAGGNGGDESRPRVVQAGSGGEERQEAHGHAEESAPSVVHAGRESAQAPGDSAQTGARMVKPAADTLRSTTAASFGTLAKVAGSRENRGGEAADQRAVTQSIDNVLQSGVVLSTGAQQALTEWIGYSQQALERNSRALGKLMGCRTAKDVMDVQFDLFKSNVEDWLRVFQISAEKTREAADRMRHR